MLSHRLAPALASVGLGCGILFSAAFARDVYSGISGRSRGESFAVSLGSAPPRMPEGELIARLTVARLNVDSPVLEGVGAATLARGAGHVPQTAFPGDEKANGSSVIAISRGKLGEAVGRLRLGDRVRLTTPAGQLGYRVVERRIHQTAGFRVDSAPEGRISLLTPFPPDSPGPAPMRLAVVLEGSD